MSHYQIFPPEELIDVEINLPVSKSVANRILIMEALAKTSISKMDGISDDIDALYNGIINSDKGTINIGAAGTAMRFLAAYYCINPDTDIILDGSERMHRRPIKPLVDTLKQLGADIEYLEQDGFPPLKIKGKKLMGGVVEIDTDISSQFVTALMLIAPYMENGLTINLRKNPVSMSYILMTLKLMELHGINILKEGNQIIISPGHYIFNESYSELDWSAAAFWAEIVALSAGFVSLPNLTFDSVQGDKKIKDFFLPLGVIIEECEDGDSLEMSASPEVHSRLNVDLSENPDLAQSLVVTCLLLNIPFRLTGLSTLKIKETDRINALKNESLKFGCNLEIENNDTIIWEGKHFPVFQLPVIETYEDHRMAMAFAPAALYIPGLIIKNHEVVGKSYPNFWDDMQKAGFTLKEINDEQLSQDILKES